MQLGMYNASVPVFVRMLGNLANILDKASAYCEAKKVQESVLLNTRLVPDMFPLALQIQLVTTHVHWACALLAGQERPNIPNTETTIAELKQRITTAIEFAQSFQKEQIDGTEDRQVKVVFPARTLEFTGEGFLLTFALPNFYFHMTTAYNILRQVGVDVGKRDFTGG